MVSKQSPQLRRNLSDVSTKSSKNKDDSLACRHIETLFPHQVADTMIPQNSVHGEHFFLPARIIYEGRTGCADKPVRKWSVPKETK